MENSKQLKLDFQIGNRKLECLNFQLNLCFMLIAKFIGIWKTKFFATHQHHRHQRQRRIFMKNWNIIKPLPLTKIRLITDFVSNRLHYTSLLLHCMTWQTLFSIFSLSKKNSMNYCYYRIYRIYIQRCLPCVCVGGLLVVDHFKHNPD